MPLGESFCIEGYWLSPFAKTIIKRCAGREFHPKKGWRHNRRQDNPWDVQYQDCDECKHKLACLIAPRAGRTFEQVVV